MRCTRRTAVAWATGSLALLASAAPAGAGAAPLTMTVTPNPAETGEMVTVANVQSCPNPGAVSMVELLVAGPVDDDILNTTVDAEGDWSFEFAAGDPGSYELTVSCVYVQGNAIYRPVTLEVQAPTPSSSSSSSTSSSTTSTSTTSTTAAPTTSAPPAPAPAPAVVARPSFTG